jgi:hypothetical protein
MLRAVGAEATAKANTEILSLAAQSDGRADSLCRRPYDFLTGFVGWASYTYICPSQTRGCGVAKVGMSRVKKAIL